VIYTFDPSDTTGNKLKHFCAPGSGAVPARTAPAHPSPGEMDWFTATKLAVRRVDRPADLGATPKPGDYVRGDASNGDTGAGMAGPHRDHGTNSATW
jgi:hypothetical protein